jgi:hypothetical protein
MDIRGRQAVNAFIRASRGDPGGVAYIQEVNTGAGKEARARADAAAAGLSAAETEVAVLKATREGSRARYQTPGLAADKTIPLITV